jgi:hypothetical protein
VSCRDDDTLKAPEQFCHSPVALFSSLPHSRAETICLAEVSHEAIHRISCGLFTAAIKIFCPLALIEEVEKNCPLSLRSEAWNFMSMWGVGTGFVIHVNNIDDHCAEFANIRVIYSFLEYNRKIKQDQCLVQGKKQTFFFSLDMNLLAKKFFFPKNKFIKGIQYLLSCPHMLNANFEFIRFCRTPREFFFVCSSSGVQGV